jgi:hypothetical protein
MWLECTHRTYLPAPNLWVLLPGSPALIGEKLRSHIVSPIRCPWRVPVVNHANRSSSQDPMTIYDHDRHVLRYQQHTFTTTTIMHHHRQHHSSFSFDLKSIRMMWSICGEGSRLEYGNEQYWQTSLACLARLAKRLISQKCLLRLVLKTKFRVHNPFSSRQNKVLGTT